MSTHRDGWASGPVYGPNVSCDWVESPDSAYWKVHFHCVHRFQCRNKMVAVKIQPTLDHVLFKMPKCLLKLMLTGRVPSESEYDLLRFSINEFNGEDLTITTFLITREDEFEEENYEYLGFNGELQD